MGCSTSSRSGRSGRRSLTAVGRTACVAPYQVLVLPGGFFQVAGGVLLLGVCEGQYAVDVHDDLAICGRTARSGYLRTRVRTFTRAVQIATRA